MKRVLLGLLCLVTTISACKKNNSNNDDDNTIIDHRNGMVSGTISPVYAASQVILTSTSNGQTDTYWSVPDSKGYFTFPDLAGGNYTLTILPTAGYTKPLDKTVVLAIGKTLDLGNLKVLALGQLAGTANVTGKVSPADAAVVVYLKGQLGHYYAEPDRSTGIFNFTDLPEGSHELELMATQGYIAPAKRSIAITNGQLTDLGTITFAANQRISEFSFKLGGTNLTFDTYVNNGPLRPHVSATYTASNLNINGSLITGNYTQITGIRTKKLTIKLDGVNGPGAYTCKGTESSEMLYTDKSTSAMSYVTDLSSSRDNGSATVIITAFDPVARTISGTFTGTLKSKPISGKTTSQELTAGVFNIKY